MGQTNVAISPVYMYFSAIFSRRAYHHHSIRLCALAHAEQASDDAIQPITKLATIEEYTRKLDELRQKDVQEANQRTHQGICPH